MKIWRRPSLVELVSAALGTVFLAFSYASPAVAQQSTASSLPDLPQPQTDARDAATLRNTPRNLLKDQEAIWTSPAKLNGSNAVGPVLLVLATTVLATTDHQVMKSHFTDKTLNDHAKTASTGLVGGFIGMPLALYGLGHLRHSDHASEAGLLGGEAVLDSLAVSEVIKVISQRERPTVDNAKGKFFQSGVGADSSFGSNHSVIAWSSAAVLASEYPGMLNQIGIYGLASGVSMTRVFARQHFPSDVLVGGAVGWMIGRYVYHRHQRYEDLGGY